MVTARLSPFMAVPSIDRRARHEHAGPVAVLLLFSVWLTHRFMFTRGLPAGTDMLGFIARAQQNSQGLQAFSIWNPNSFGGIRQFTLESVLGLLTKLTGDPVMTVKLFALATFAGAGLACYLLSWRWFGRRSAALASALLYASSQQSLSHMASGHLNVSLAIALTPLVLYFWIECVNSFTFHQAIAVGLVLSGLVVARLDMVLYVLPFMLLYPVLSVCVRGGWRATGKNVVATSGLVLAVGTVINAYEILPILGGLRAFWVSPSLNLGRQAFLDRSLGFYPSLLGFGREIGYLAFTGQQTWFSHPFLPFQTYQVFAALLVALALGSLRWHRDIRTIFLVCSGLTAAFLAKGFRSPLGGPYGWVVHHVPFMAALRDPNRWLIFESLAFAMLGGLTISHLLEERRNLKTRGTRGWRRTLVPASISLLIAATALPDITTLARGFLTVDRPLGQVALLSRVSADHGNFLVASVPFDQARQFLSGPRYSGWEHDLGADSSAYTGHAAVGDGDWNQWAADSVAYDATLLKSSDPAFGSLLGSVGVKYLVDFSYPATDPRLQPQSLGPFFQQRALDGMPTVVPSAMNSGGTLLRIPSVSPWLSFRPNVAVIFGGRSGIAALAAQPGVVLSDWAAVTADDALAVGGISELLSLIQKSNLIVFSNETLEDVAVLATPAIARLGGITSNAGQADATQIVQSDASTRSGTLADKLAPVPTVAASSSTAFRLTEPLPDGELWYRVETGPTPATLTFSLDGRDVGHITPRSPLSGGFRWMTIPITALPAGNHSLNVTATRSGFGDTYELDEAKLTHASDRLTAVSSLSAAVQQQREHVLVSLAVDDGQKWAALPGIPNPSNGHNGSGYWVAPKDRNVQASPSQDEPGAMQISTDGHRSLYTLIGHYFKSPQDWSDRLYLTLKFLGTGSGLTYRLVIGSAAGSSATYLFTDDQQGWTTEMFNTRSPTSSEADFDWSQIRSVRVALDSKEATTSVTFSPLVVSSPFPTVSFSYPLPVPAAPGSVSFASRNGTQLAGGPYGGERFTLSKGRLNISVPFGLLGDGARLVVTPSVPITTTPALPVAFTRSADGGYRFSFSSQAPGVLVLAQAFDHNWLLSEGGAPSALPIPTQSLLIGFVVSAGNHTGSLEIRGHHWVWLGWLVSLVGLILAIAVLMGWPRRLRRDRSLRRSEAGIRAPLVLVGLAVLTIITVSVVELPARSIAAGPAYRWPTLVTSQVWTALSPSSVSLDRQSVLGVPATTVRVSRGRPTFSILEDRLTSVGNWVGHPHLYLYFKGQGSGSEYHLIVQNDRNNFSSFGFLDSRPGWRIITIDLEAPESITGVISLSDVTDIRIASNDKEHARVFAVGPILLSQPAGMA
jgi:hypothetical protein